MELVDRLTAWSHARQRLGRPARSPLEALRAVVAVYATHPTAPLALWTRSRSFTPAAYRRIDRDRKAVRLPAMRRTVFLVPRDHVAEMFAATRASEAHARRGLRRWGFSDADYERVARRILAAAREPLPAQALQDAAGLDGPQLGTVLRCLRYEGRLVTVAGDSLLSSPHSYVATATWVPEVLDGPDRAESLARLAGEYLRAYGPARVADFAWWTGATKRAAADAVAEHDTIDLGHGLLLPAIDGAGFGRVKPVRGVVNLLPKWDAYTMGHAPDGRARFVHPDVQPRVYTPMGVGLPGDGNPVALVDGRAAATWTFTLKDGPAVQPFEPLGRLARRAVDERLETIAGLLTG